MGRRLRNMLRGAATIFSICPRPMRPSDTSQGRWSVPADRSDADAIHSDWLRVGDAMRSAMGWGADEVASHVAEKEEQDSHV